MRMGPSRRGVQQYAQPVIRLYAVEINPVRAQLAEQLVLVLRDSASQRPRVENCLQENILVARVQSSGTFTFFFTLNFTVFLF